MHCDVGQSHHGIGPCDDGGDGECDEPRRNISDLVDGGVHVGCVLLSHATLVPPWHLDCRKMFTFVAQMSIFLQSPGVKYLMNLQYI